MVHRQAVINRAVPIRPRQRFALRIRDRHHWHHCELAKNRGEIRQIEPAMQRRQRFIPVLYEQRKVQLIGVEVNDVERISEARRPMQRYEVIGQRIFALGIEA